MNNFKGTKNFSLSEMKCRDGSLVISDGLIKHANNMQKLRDWYKKPMKVNSWYRSVAYNKKVGGVAGSQHLKGMACDIAKPSEWSTFTKERKREWINNVKKKWHEICGGGGGFGDYDTFIHLDSRSNKVDFDYRKSKIY